MRALLLKGADREAKDLNGKTPRDMLDAMNVPDSIKDDLDLILVSFPGD